MTKKVAGLLEVELSKENVDQKAFMDVISVMTKLRKKLQDRGGGKTFGSLRATKDSSLVQDFDQLFWVPLKCVFDSPTNQDSLRKTLIIDWVCAYCEQTRIEMPPWMMTKGQHEAAKKLQEALEQ